MKIRSQYLRGLLEDTAAQGDIRIIEELRTKDPGLVELGRMLGEKARQGHSMDCPAGETVGGPLDCGESPDGGKDPLRRDGHDFRVMGELNGQGRL